MASFWTFWRSFSKLGEAPSNTTSFKFHWINHIHILIENLFEYNCFFINSSVDCFFRRRRYILLNLFLWKKIDTIVPPSRPRQTRMCMSSESCTAAPAAARGVTMNEQLLRVNWTRPIGHGNLGLLKVTPQVHNHTGQSSFAIRSIFKRISYLF